MYDQFASLKDITHNLHPMYVGQIERAGPVIAALEVKAFFRPVQSPPAPSPVAAHLLSMKFKTWRDISKHLKKLRRQGSQLMGRATYDIWCSRIIQFSRDKHVLLAYAIPLFVESQMNAISAQDVLLNLLAPIIESDASIYVDSNVAKHTQDSPNAAISVVIHAGKVPFALTCHESSTLARWHNHLEAATVLLLPQIVLQAEMNMSEAARGIMKKALREELSTWQTKRPIPGEIRNWSWLPRLM